LKENALNLLSSPEKISNILIFDDVLDHGYTFGRIIKLLKSLNLKKIYLSTIARTTPKKFKKPFSFP
jgi:predicted amidophosphoribosyltransferase